MELHIKQCACGKVPKHLSLSYNGQGGKWAEASCGACGEWSIEFRTNYLPLDDAECIELARLAWNEAPRAGLETAAKANRDYEILSSLLLNSKSQTKALQKINKQLKKKIYQLGIKNNG